MRRERCEGKIGRIRADKEQGEKYVERTLERKGKSEKKGHSIRTEGDSRENMKRKVELEK